MTKQGTSERNFLKTNQQGGKKVIKGDEQTTLIQLGTRLQKVEREDEMFEHDK